MRLLLAACLAVSSAAYAEEPKTVEVRLQGSPDVVLQQQQAWAGGDWTDLCYGECAARAPLHRWLRIGGENVPPSASFAIRSDQEGPVVLTVKRPDRALRPLGWVLVGVGGSAFVAGIFAMLMGSLRFFSTQPPDQTTIGVGAVVAGVGGANAIAGAILLALGHTTAVSGPIVFAPDVLGPPHEDVVPQPVYPHETALVVPLLVIKL